jgi:hypothetical protein
MRKVLLATTALVALSVTAAQADVSISGNQNFEITDDGATSSWGIDGDVQIIGTSTTDSGLSLTAAHHINTSVGTLTVNGAANEYAENAHVDDSYMDISGDFGSFRAGNTDDALDRMDGAYPANWDENGNTDGGFAIGGGQPAVNASFIAPTISGVTVYGASTAEGAYTGMGVNYSNGPVSVVYQSGTDGTTDKSLMAVNVSMAGMTVGFGTGDQDAAGTKTEYSAMGVKYAVNDALSVYAVSQKQKGNSTASSVGGYYTIAPGLQFAAETATNASDTTTTYAHLKVSF